MGNLRGPFQKSRSTSAGQSLVGPFLRAKREALGLSQRALGQLFEPTVTTQFISNIERGVTPLPPVHIATLVRVLKISEADLISVLEREYAAKISHRVGRSESAEDLTADEDRAYFHALHEAYRSLDPAVKESFLSVCETLLHVPKPKTTKSK